jgi:LmbE family N-acetylglucosaminyl deacetylase
MNRRQFLYQSLAASALVSARAQAADNTSDVFIERDRTGKPHAGKVLAAIQPHADDLAIFAGGTLAKLLNEGYTGHLIRATNDDMAGRGTIAETALANERDVQEFVKLMGLKGNFSLNYGNHEMDAISKPEMRSRLIFLFRLLKVDTVICYDPWGTYEENPDHYVTAQCVEAACWMAGGDKDYPEHFAAGLKPHGVTEKYYFARGPQLVNRVVDIGSYTQQKIDANLVNKTQGPAGNNGAQLRASLAGNHMRLPLLGSDDATANREYIREFLLRQNRVVGKKYGLQYAEEFHYIGPPQDEVSDYVKKNAVRE